VNALLLRVQLELPTDPSPPLDPVELLATA
jgi:hypothetical protein